MKLIRVFSEFEFSVNLNFIPTSFFISLLPLSPQLIVQLIDLLDLFPHLGNSSSTRFPSVSNPRKVPLKKKTNNFTLLFYLSRLDSFHITGMIRVNLFKISYI